MESGERPRQLENALFYYLEKIALRPRRLRQGVEGASKGVEGSRATSPRPRQSAVM